MPLIVQAARDMFGSSAGTINVVAGWRAADSTLSEPAMNGSDGWTTMHHPATLTTLQGLREQGFTHVALAPTRGQRRSPVRLSALLS